MEIEEKHIGSNSLFLERQKTMYGRKELGMILPQQHALLTYFLHESSAKVCTASKNSDTSWGPNVANMSLWGYYTFKS